MVSLCLNVPPSSESRPLGGSEDLKRAEAGPKEPSELLEQAS